MTYITKLKLSDTQRADMDLKPEQRLRRKLLDHLNDQKSIAEADLKNEAVHRTRFKFVRDETTGETQRIEVPKIIRRWWWKTDEDKVMLQLRYGNKPLQITAKEGTIEVGTLDKLPETIDTVIEAVKAGELDKQLKAALGERRLKLRKVS